MGSVRIGFSVEEWPDAVHRSRLVPDAGMQPLLQDHPKGPCRGYVIDHIVPDCLGADEPSNMQWQTVSEAKDKWDRKVCGNGRRYKPSHQFNDG